MRRSEAAAFSSAMFVFSGRSGSARRLFSLLRLGRRSQDLGPLFIDWPGLAFFFFFLSLVWEAKYKHGLPLGQHRWQRGLRDKRGVFHLSSLPPRTKRTGCRTFLHLFCVYGVCACSVNATDYSALYRHYILHYLLQWKCCYWKIFLMLKRKCQQQIVSYIKWLFVRCSSSMSLFF